MTDRGKTPKAWMILNAADNVGVAVRGEGLKKGAVISLTPASTDVIVREEIAQGHKVAIRAIPAGSDIIKFGHRIGVATRPIEIGEHVHVHNVKMADVHAPDEGGTACPQEHSASWGDLPAVFKGYLRPDGRAGVRNYLVVGASVNCSASVTKAVCRHFLNRDLSQYGLDGIIPVTHSSGCAQAIGGLSYQVLNRTLAGWIYHPNVVGAVIIGLGCEGTTYKSVLEARDGMGLGAGIPIEHLNIQDAGGTTAGIEAGIRSVEKVLSALPRFERRELPVSMLSLALNCGGSDGFSGLTANPALGVTSDILVSKGATVALAEIPECHGAEELLYDRCADESVRKILKKTFEWWLDYADRHKVSLNNNLAPGNIAGGITTIIEKSLGAVAKAGTTPLNEVVGYAEPITRKGFTLMNTPGFDPVSVTGLVAGGCNLVAFTTGRGSVYGCAIAPTIKIATNSEIFRRLSGDMDVDAGKALEDGSVGPVGIALYRFMIDVANGTRTCSESLGLGWEEFTPWPVGETL